MKTFLNISILLVLVASFAFGQLATPNTTLSANVAANSTSEWCLTSATGVVLPSLAGATNGSYLWIDKEAVQVTAAGSSATCFKVKRGQLGTSASASHALVNKVWIGTPSVSSGDTSRPFTGAFVGTAPSGSCTATDQYTLPVIVTGGVRGAELGEVWDCFGTIGYWIRWLDRDTVRRWVSRGAAVDAVPGGFRTEILINYQGSTTGSVNGIRGGITLATGTTAGYGYIYGVQGSLHTGAGTFNMGSGFGFGVSGQLYLSGGTVTSGHIAGVGAEISGSSGTVGSPQSYVDLVYAQNSTGVVNSFFKGYGGTTFVFDVNTGGVGAQIGTTGAATTAAGWLKINANGSTRYINLWSTAP